MKSVTEQESNFALTKSSVLFPVAGNRRDSRVIALLLWRHDSPFLVCRFEFWTRIVGRGEEDCGIQQALIVYGLVGNEKKDTGKVYEQG